MHSVNQAGSHFRVDAADVVQVRQAQAPHCAWSNRTIGARPAARQGLFKYIHQFTSLSRERGHYHRHWAPDGTVISRRCCRCGASPPGIGAKVCTALANAKPAGSLLILWHRPLPSFGLSQPYRSRGFSSQSVASHTVSHPIQAAIKVSALHTWPPDERPMAIPSPTCFWPRRGRQPPPPAPPGCQAQ